MLASKLHQQAAAWREKGQSERALQTYDLALAEYLSSQNFEGQLRVLLEKIIVYKHLYKDSFEPAWQELAQQTYDRANTLANQQPFSDDLLSLLKFSAGELQLLNQQFEAAVNFYQQALQLETPDTAPYFNISAHLGFAQCLTGEISAGLAKLKESIQKLQQQKMDTYTQDVWLSGAYLKLAIVLFQEKLPDWNEALKKATIIIENNPDLTIRAKQLRLLVDQIQNNQLELPKLL